MAFIPLYDLDRASAQGVIERLGPRCGKLTNDEAAQLLRAINIVDPIRFIEENILIVDKRARLVSLKLNRGQRFIVERLIEQIVEKGYGKLIIDKARQLGVSTIVEALAVYFGLTHRNVKIAIVGNKASNSEHIYGIASTAIKNLPEPWKPPGPDPMARAARFEYTENGRETPTYFKVDTAGDEDLLRGFTPAFLHASEFAFWPSAQRALTAVEQGIPDYDTIEILESTGWPGTYFERLWRAAVEGKSDFIAIFLPWYWGEDYVKPLSDTGGRLYPVEVYGDSGEIIPLEEWEAEEKKLLSLYKTCPIDGGQGITVEHLNWRRWVIMNKFGQELAMFNIEHPTVWQDSFNAPSVQVFPKKVLAEMLDRARNVSPVARMAIHRSAEERIVGEHQRRIAAAIEEYQPLQSHELPSETLVPFDDPDAAAHRVPITIWRQPEDGRKYWVTADTADGANPSDGDYLVADVWRLPYPGEQIVQCAQVRGRIHVDVFAEIVFQLSRYYGIDEHRPAEIIPEANHVDIIRYLKGKYGVNLYVRDRQDDSVVEKVEMRYGWHTNSKTRPIMIGEGKRLVRQRAVEINSITTLEEMRDFIPKNRKGKIRIEAAGTGHDDAVFSFMVMAAVSADRFSQQETAPTPEEVTARQLEMLHESWGIDDSSNDWMHQ